MSQGPVTRATAPPDGVIRWSAGRKTDAVLRILSGEPVRALADELGLDTERLIRWRDEFVKAGKEALKSRRPDRDPAALALRQAQQKIGQLTLENEVLRAAGGRARPRRAGAAGVKRAEPEGD